MIFPECWGLITENVYQENGGFQMNIT